MRALTLTQPWAGLVAAGLKPIENRSRCIIAPRDFGKPFAIHASRQIDEAVYNRIFEIAPELLDGYLDASWYRLSRITSAVLAVANINGHLLPTMAPAAIQVHETILRWWFRDQVGYLVGGSRVLDKPIPTRGWQSFWTLPPAVETAVLEQLGAPS